MDSPLEFEGKNVAMALRAASKALDIPKDQLEYRVLSHGSSGIFGLVGVKNAKISVAPANQHLKSRVERLVETTLGGNGADEAGSLSAEAPAEESPVDTPPAQAVTAPPEVNTDENDDSLSFDEAAKIGEEALRRIVDNITTGADIRVTCDQRAVSFQIEGGNPALLIGKKGQTLDAIQFIVEKIINKNLKNRTRISVDVEGYLEKRKANLEELSLKTAEKVSRTGKPGTVGLMNAHDRRVVHVTLKNDKRIRTQSLGSGVLRKVMVFPKKIAGRKKGSG